MTHMTPLEHQIALKDLDRAFTPRPRSEPILPITGAIVVTGLSLVLLLLI